MTYRRIRSLARGIEVLRYLNTVQGAHPVEIGRQLGLPRPTVHRILETLEEMKLVYQGAYSREFRLTPGVRQLAASDDKFGKLRAAAWPIMRELTAELIWPSDLAVFSDDSMLIIESTHRLSPVSGEIGIVGQSRSMLAGPLGRTYLAHSRPAHRDAILERLRNSDAKGAAIARDEEAIDQMMVEARQNGFSMCPDLPHDRTASMAVPLRVDGYAIASLNLVWHLTDMSFDEAREALAGPLLAARDRIEVALNTVRSETLGSATGTFQTPAQDSYTRRTREALGGRTALNTVIMAAV